ncbi:hypothetical protein V557_01522 [Pseudomonas aeruginosa BWH056]|nr:hypothetical protein V557_01522 [Pseudomonas aeruginosa BWH056]
MRIALIEADAIDSPREQCLLVRSHHVFQVEREQTFDHEPITVRTKNLQKSTSQFLLIAGRIGHYQNPNVINFGNYP